jgi:hypothetical protein
MSRKEEFPEFFRFCNDLIAGNLNPKALELFQSSPDDIVNQIHNFAQVVEDDLPLQEANAVSSRYHFGEDMHRVVLDLDMEALLVPSSTKGHYHLILDKVVPWEIYQELLMALARAGIISSGYAEASIIKGATWIRTPWNKKTDVPVTAS